MIKAINSGTINGYAVKAGLCMLLMSYLMSAFSQDRQLQGTLKTKDGQPIPHASVMLKNKQQRVLAFQASESKGAFTLRVPDTTDIADLHIEINHLGYRKVSVPLSDGQDHYDILMEQQAIDLAEVEIKSRPTIRSMGDTLSYDVSSFTKPEDRTIGDVLRRMPGMEVEENGQIKYNGKAISNFYIDGDDLLDEKYAIGTKTIPHAMVKDIEVMQNHQPLKVLQRKTWSENVAINLKIKDEARLKLTGQAKPGGGLPAQYDGELNTILFNKNNKMLHVGKANNVGTDLATDFTAFNQTNRMSSLGNTRPAQLLSSGTVGNPALQTNRYYFNNSGSLNANNLVNLKNGLQLKSNVGLMFDNNDMNYLTINNLYLTNDTISYSEIQQIGKRPFLMDFSLNAEANKDGYYFNNTLKIGYSGETGNSALISNDIDMGQRLRSRVRDFSNTLEYMPALRNKNIVSINWYFNHFNQPQTLNIHPGIHADALNDGQPFDAIYQYTETPTWFNTVSVGYRLPNGFIKHHYRIGTLNEWQTLNSQLQIMQRNGEHLPYTGSQANNLRWQRHNAQFNANYEIKNNKWEALLSLPLTWQRITYNDVGFRLSEAKERLLFNPFFRAKYMTTAEDYLSFNYIYNNLMGNINGVYRGAILTNYRNLRANEAVLEERNTHNAGLGYNFQRNISMLFINMGIQYMRTMANTIAANVVTDNIMRTILLPYENDVSTLSTNAGISKYIFALGATAGVKGSWSTSRYNQFLNGELLPYHNVSFAMTPSVEARLWNRISLTYEGTGTWMTSKLVTSETALQMPDRQIQRFDQSVSLMYSPFRNAFLRLSGRHQYVTQQGMEAISYFFADTNIRYKLSKWNTDLELDLTNMANITEYETYSLSANQFGYSHYQLRGRMAVAKLAFNF